MMVHNFKIHFLLLFSIVFLSCRNNKDEIYKNEILFITEINGGIEYIYIEYDDLNRVISIDEDAISIEYEYSFFYNDDDLLLDSMVRYYIDIDDDITYYSFSYKDEKLINETKIRYVSHLSYERKDTAYIYYEYKDNLLSKIITKNSDLTVTSTDSIIYNNELQISKIITQNENYSYTSYQFEYDSEGNIIRKFGNTWEILYQYDDKRNPIKELNIFSCYGFGNYKLDSDIDTYSGLLSNAFSNSNVTYKKRISNDQVISEYHCEYTYNEYAYPITRNYIGYETGVYYNYKE